MEDRGCKRKGKRIRNDDEEDNNQSLAFTQQEPPSFVSCSNSTCFSTKGGWPPTRPDKIEISGAVSSVPTVLLEALEMHKDIRNCPYLKRLERTREQLHPDNLELLLRIILNDLLRIPRSSDPDTGVGRSLVLAPSASLPPRIPESSGQKLQLRVETKIPDSLFSGDTIKGEKGSEIYVSLVDLDNGRDVQTGPASAAEVNVVVVEGDFKEEIKYGLDHDFFKSREVKNRKGKPQLLAGTLQVTLKDGVGIFGDLSFTDNSSFNGCKQFRLGFKIDSGYFEGTRVMEAITNAFKVKDKRGKVYQKHRPPALLDEVWRLDNIRKDGPVHIRLEKAKIKTVEDLVRLHVKDPQRLRTMVEVKGDTKWETTIKHAMNFFPLGEKFYVYYTDGTKNFGIIFNHIHQPEAWIAHRQVASLECLDQTQKKFYVNKAYENWNQVEECDDQFFSSCIISKEMQPDPQIQPNYTLHSDPQIQPNYTSAPQQLPGNEEFNTDDFYADVPFKAVVGWLKIKAALKWGIMVRNSAAKKKAKLTELD